MTPSAWNAGIFGMVRTLSENVVIPIAGMVISFVLIYELITMVDERYILSILFYDKYHTYMPAPYLPGS